MNELNSHIRLDQVARRYYCAESEMELAALTQYEKVSTQVTATRCEGAVAAAAEVARIITRTVQEKGRCVIGLGAGKCALDVYDELVKLYFADKLSMADVVAFSISELGLGVVAEDSEQSTMTRLRRRLYNKVDIDPANIHTFSRGATKENVHQLCRAYEAEIADAGGLDLVVCQLTKNGSMAFNEPGSSMNTTCRLMLLGSESRGRVAEAFQCDDAPLTAVTLGIGSLLKADHIVCVAWGEDSAIAVHNTIEGRVTDLVPASFLQMHHDARLVVDLEAASHLTRISFPWRVTSCDWNPYLIRRAIVWLCQQTNKPILKLTNKDYNDNGLGELVALYGSAYNVNIITFNDLQHTITGWPGGKPEADDTYRPERATPYPKRVLVFSPHPDDAIVSMGGTLRRLVQQGHDVHVAFQTSGDVAVSDEDVLRTLMLIERMGAHHLTAEQEAANKSIREVIANKTAGDPDHNEVRDIKGQILTCEGIMACRHMGVPADHVHELNMAFCTGHPFGCGRVTDADVNQVADLIERLQPHQIFVADDLTEPYGTHAPATGAVLTAVDRLADRECMRQCRVWLYRGQWGQWDVDCVEMAVPMSPEEFRTKRDAILKYQSQIHDALFRAAEDGHLSWQNSIDRNRAMADHYSRLGLASYEAIEAFVQYRR